MNKSTFLLLENYMLSCMEDGDSAHDIGRKEQYENPALCHAEVGGNKAYQFLLAHRFPEAFAEKVRDCIQSHRYRRDNPPRSLEAKILFDADKIDVSGALGIARTLLYQGQTGEPLYSLLSDGRVSDGGNHRRGELIYVRQILHR
ncbi:MAG: hypothetical protein Q4C52_07985 [Eubacteriales bacterium]|nr:hypothetical protein [Eubacteriales bacterium]